MSLVYIHTNHNTTQHSKLENKSYIPSLPTILEEDFPNQSIHSAARGGPLNQTPHAASSSIKQRSPGSKNLGAKVIRKLIKISKAKYYILKYLLKNYQKTSRLVNKH